MHETGSSTDLVNAESLVDDEFSSRPPSRVHRHSDPAANVTAAAGPTVSAALAHSPPTHSPPTLRPPIGIVAGAICGGISAIVYTMSNIALRQCVGVDPILVSAVKAAPTVVFLAPFLVWMRVSGHTIATSSRQVPRFIFASLLGQLVGNGAFQISLGIIGPSADHRPRRK